MKILQIIDTLLVGGAEDVAINLAIGFKESGHDSNILILTKEKSKKNIKKLKLAGIKILTLKSPRYSIASILEVKRIIKDFQIDIIQTHRSGFYYFLSNLMTKKVFVNTAHGLYENETGPKGKLFYKIFLPFTSALVSVSESVNKSIKKNHQVKNTQVINNGIKIFDRHALNKPKLGNITKQLIGNTIFVNVANLLAVKNHELLINSFALAKIKRPKIKLIIAGDGPLKEKIDSLILSLKLENDVFLLGSRDDIQQILDISDIFILSSKSEGLALCLLEAMERSLPVVSTRASGSNSEIISDGKNGYLVDSNEKDFSEAMARLDANKKLRKNMGRNGREIVEKKYSIDIMVKNYLRLYKKLLKK
ncbi:MAG: glycosyltransferase [Candidatus Berkelbacteria bacterium]